MLITEPCKKGQNQKKKKSDQYFILLFSFQVDCTTSADAVLTTVTLNWSHKWHFSGSKAPISSCSLPTALQKCILGCQERLARAKDRKKKKEVGVGAPGTKLKYAFVMYQWWCAGLFTLLLHNLKLRVVKTRCSKPI